MKRLLLLFLAISITVPLFAERWTDPSTGFTWFYQVFDGKTARVTGTLMHSTELNWRIEIPDEINGHPVTIIGSNAFLLGRNKMWRIDSISLPDSIRVIEPFAFANRTDGNVVWGTEKGLRGNFVTTLYLPANLETIGEGAFANWPDLDTVIFPDGLKSIGPDAFSNCKSLALVELPDSVTSIGKGAFEKCTSLSSVIISYSTCAKGLDPKAFSQCDKLELIAINGNPRASLDTLSKLNGFKYPREWRSCQWYISEEFANNWVQMKREGAFKGIDFSVVYADKWKDFLDTVRDAAERIAKLKRPVWTN